ncbi:MAG TPA: hypothetical protein PLX89_10230 [Verrucomicrobiota bacterium]|nr:hypothetical protein [Verrucomicrobiales bacterium]HRI13373.1 hypothetical protein [Verrucomicrobiota bacterium]
MKLTSENVPPKLTQPVAALLLSAVLAIFLADAGMSLVDDLLNLCGVRLLNPIRGLLSFLCLLTGLAIYGLMGLTPAIPKRIFLPVSLVGPLLILSLPLLSIYFYSDLPVVALLFSAVQVGVGLWLVHSTQGGFRLRWPLIRAEHLGSRRFSWRNLLGFVGVNLGLLLPGVVLYLAFCVHLAVAHLTDGFLGLHFGGISSTARTYERADGKSVHLIPMMHIGDARFYTQLSQTFPSNSVILLEGVTDEKHHLKDKLSYQRAAESLGLEEQRENFDPAQGIARRADVDVDQFAPSTLEALQLVTAMYSKGPSLPLFLELATKGQDPQVADQLWRDLLTLRNEHLLKEIETALLETGTVMVPWGAAHMPGLAMEIQKAGFKLSSSREYQVANFRTMWDRIRSK